MTKSDPILRCVDDSGATGEFYALDRKTWREIRKSQGENKGKPFEVPESGIIRLPCWAAHKKLRIFVEAEDVDIINEGEN